MTEPVRMVNSRGTLESLRHIGITLEEGITELVDNAVDAGANNIGISLHTGGISGERTLVIADDGVGIPESIPGKDLTSTVQHVLRFGGKIPHHGRAIPIGKYGFGLSQTAAGLSLRTDVSSKVEAENGALVPMIWNNYEPLAAIFHPNNRKDRTQRSSTNAITTLLLELWFAFTSRATLKSASLTIPLLNACTPSLAASIELRLLLA